MSPRKTRDPEPLLPLTPALFHVLLALGDGQKHGYAILKEVSRSTDGKVRLSAGTLYGIIKRLLEEGMIVEIDERPARSLDDERRRYYRLSEFGRQVALAEAARLEEMLAIAAAKNLVKQTV